MIHLRCTPFSLVLLLDPEPPVNLHPQLPFVPLTPTKTLNIKFFDSFTTTVIDSIPCIPLLHYSIQFKLHVLSVDPSLLFPTIHKEYTVRIM